MTKIFLEYFNRKWIILISLSFLFFAIIGYLMSYLNIKENIYFVSLVFGFAGISITASFFIFYLLVKILDQRIKQVTAELQSTSKINHLTKIPLDLGLDSGDWPITASFLTSLVREIYSKKPKLVLECGSGTSTLVVASCLKDIGDGKIISLDHLDKYAQKTKNLLREEGLTDYSQVVFAPLKEYEMDLGKLQWYDNKFEKFIDEKIDLLIVDGPPGHLQYLSRYPAVPILKVHLSDKCLIMLDDGLRNDEQEIAKKWADMLNVDLQLNETGRGFWIIGNT